MKASEELRTVIGLTDAEMQGWIDLFREKSTYIKPTDNRRLRLEEIRHDVNSYFIAEMDSRHRDKSPVTDEKLYQLIDQFLIEIGIAGIPPRRKPHRKPPWQKSE